jgi:hypothetical protein
MPQGFSRSRLDSGQINFVNVTFGQGLANVAADKTLREGDLRTRRVCGNR